MVTVMSMKGKTMVKSRVKAMPREGQGRVKERAMQGQGWVKAIQTRPQPQDIVNNRTKLNSLF